MLVIILKSRRKKWAGQEVHTKDRKNWIQSFGVKTWRTRPLEYHSVGGRILLKCTVQEQDLRARTAFVWLGTHQWRAFGKHANKTSGTIRPWKFLYCLSPLASQVRLPQRVHSWLVSYKMSSFKTIHSHNQSSPWISFTCSNATLLSHIVTDISNLRWSIKTNKVAFTGVQGKDGITRKVKGLFVVQNVGCLLNITPAWANPPTDYVLLASP